MKSFTVNKNDSGQRLDKFISKTVPLLPKNLMYKYIRIKRIKLNGKRADISMKLSENDIVDMYINDEFFAPAPDDYDFLNASKNISVVYEDENILLADKPVGLLSHPDKGEYVDTLICRVKRYLYEKGEFNPKDENSFTPALANRIDRNTGGIVMVAKNAESLRILNEKIKKRELHKYYLCIVHGRPEKSEDILEGYLIKDEDKNQVKVYKKKREYAKTIRTKYRVLDTRGELSLIEIELLTGRTHQIRAHFASIGHPLLGDGKYGSNSQNKKYGYKKQFLYSYKLTFDFETDGGTLDYLNGKSFEVSDIWFRTAFYNGEI